MRAAAVAALAVRRAGVACAVTVDVARLAARRVTRVRNGALSAIRAARLAPAELHRVAAGAATAVPVRDAQSALVVTDRSGPPSSRIVRRRGSVRPAPRRIVRVGPPAGGRVGRAPAGGRVGRAPARDALAVHEQDERRDDQREPHARGFHLSQYCYGPNGLNALAPVHSAENERFCSGERDGRGKNGKWADNAE